jgi:hypothetical protein
MGLDRDVGSVFLFSAAKHGLLACMGLHTCCGIYPEWISNKNVCTAGHP